MRKEKENKLIITDTQRKNIVYANMKKYIDETYDDAIQRKAKIYVKKYNVKNNTQVMNGVMNATKKRHCSTKSQWQWKIENDEKDGTKSDRIFIRNKNETCFVCEENNGETEMKIVNAEIVRHINMNRNNKTETYMKIYDMFFKVKTVTPKTETVKIDGEKYNTDEILKIVMSRNMKIYTPMK